MNRIVTPLPDPAINELAVKARNELDVDKREQLYHDLRRKMQNEQVARQKNVEGFVSGSNFDLVFYRNVTK